MDDRNIRYNSQESHKMQKYYSIPNYPFPEPKNIYRINPLCLKSLKTLDVDDLQDVFGKNIQAKKSMEEGQRQLKNLIINESSEIKELKDAIEHAKLNQILARQMNQNILLRKQKIIKEAEEEELNYREYLNEKRKQKEQEEKKKQELIKNREINLQQIRDKKLQQEEAEREYERDKQLVNDMIQKMKEEELQSMKEDQRKKEINKLYMQNAIKEREIYKQKEKDNEKNIDEDIKKYNEQIENREKNLAKKKNDLQTQKDIIFSKLCEEEAKRKAEQEYWDEIRSELHREQDIKKMKDKQKEEEEKRKKMRDDVVNSALEQIKYKAMKKKEDELLDEKYKQELLKKYAQDEKIEKERQEKHKQQLIDIQNTINKQRELKYIQYQKQVEQEMDEINKNKEQENAKRYIIEQEKLRLLKENEELLKRFYPTGYYKAKESLKSVSKPNPNDTKHNIIYNNIFGNSNPNKSTAYPKYGKIKNFVYDIGIQDVNHNINIKNYPMYNATANNDYDSYPSPEEYKMMMEKTGQKNYAYAGGEFKKGIPWNGQRPIFTNQMRRNNFKLSDEINDFNSDKLRMSNYSDIKINNNLRQKSVNLKSTLGYYNTEGNYNNNNKEKYKLLKIAEPA